MDENNENNIETTEEAEIIPAAEDGASLKDANDRYLRVLAEFDNFRKRTEREKSSFFESGAREVLIKILPTLDAFERAFAAEDDGQKFKEGMQMVFNNLKTALDGLGLKEIPAMGEQFDPNLHNAVMHAEDENFGVNIVAEELQKGYMYKDKPLRYSMVKVAN